MGGGAGVAAAGAGVASGAGAGAVGAGVVGAGAGVGGAPPTGSSARTALLNGSTSSARIRIPPQIDRRESVRVNNMVLASKVSIRKTLQAIFRVSRW